MGSLFASQLAGRPLDADDPCAADAQRIDFASVVFCVPRSNDLYEFKVHPLFGLQFWPQAFIGERRVSPTSYYDAHGNAPLDGTYIFVSVISRGNWGVERTRENARLVQILNEALRTQSADQPFTREIDRRKFEFRRRDISTIVGISEPHEAFEQVKEIWVRLDATSQPRHTMICTYSQSDKSLMFCASLFPIGNGVAGIRLTGGTQERSFRFSEKIRADIESFIVPNR